MNLLPKSKENFAEKDYWNFFFKKRGKKAFEWYGEYSTLAEHLHKYIKTQENILIAGCGNSTLGRDLYTVGYSNITNIDISPVVIKQMKQNKKDGSKYLQMDVTKMDFENESFNVVLDKGTLDALLPNEESEQIQLDVEKYFNEIERVLKIGGRFICISLLQEHVLKNILSYFAKQNWMLRIVRCFDAEKEDVDFSFPVFMVICTKVKAFPRMVLEINLDNSNKLQKLENSTDMLTSVKNAQQTAFVCGGLKKSNLSKEGEVSIDLHRPGSSSPRFTVFIVDTQPRPTNSQYSAFVVPQGRESEWLFSTPSGRKHLVELTKHNRLAIITLHRGEEYDSLESIQNEMAGIVCNLAPPNLKNKKIAFLSVGSDIGKRIVRYEGSSKCSGNYVIEDIEKENGDKFRRLFFTSSQLVIQSEAKLKTVKSRKGAPKEVVDLNCLTCEHHTYMTVATSVACQNKKGSVCVIGLGGGALCSFLNKFLPQTNIMAIDIDEDILKIATDWFGLQQNDRLQVKIQDGLEYLKETALKGDTFDTILYDVDSKDTSIGMSCPPQEFLADEIVNAISKIIQDKGLFIINLVIRDQSLRPKVLSDLKRKFKTIISYKLEEDLNEVAICTNSSMTVDDLRTELKNSCISLDNYLKRNTVNSTIDVSEFMNALNINS